MGRLASHLFERASYQKSVNAEAGHGAQTSLRHPTDHLPPVILLPETSVHLASLPPTPRVTFVYLIFRTIQQPLRQLLPPVLCERSGCCLREIPCPLPHIFLNGICQQLEAEETDPSSSSIPRTYAKRLIKQVGS